jgi:hypothetical protein
VTPDSSIASTAITGKETTMSDSVLGDDFEPERQKVFFRKIGEIMLRKREVSREADHVFLDSLENQIRRGRGTFHASARQFEWLGNIHDRLSPGSRAPDEMVDHLISEGEEIVRENTLPPGRMNMLKRILDLSKTRELSNKEVSMLQFLVLEGRGDHGGDY